MNNSIDEGIASIIGCQNLLIRYLLYKKDPILGFGVWYVDPFGDYELPNAKKM